MSNSLGDKLQRDEICLGVALMYPNPNAIEVLGKGWDWLWIDDQHGQFEYHDLLHATQVADLSGLPTVIRPCSLDSVYLGKMMDTRVEGLMVPMINSAEQAEAIVRAMYFPPLGTRSYGGRRVMDCDGDDYYQQANERAVFLAQIETPEAVDAAEAIAAVPGVDGLFLGGDDLRVQMGLPMSATYDDSERLVDALERTGRAARNAGKVAGCVAPSPSVLTRAVDCGYRLIAGGCDVVFLRNGASEQVGRLRDTLQGIHKPHIAEKAAVG